MTSYEQMWQQLGKPDKARIMMLCAGCHEFKECSGVEYRPTSEGIYQVATCSPACKERARRAGATPEEETAPQVEA